jgi:hypothetical protein
VDAGSTVRPLTSDESCLAMKPLASLALPCDVQHTCFWMPLRPLPCLLACRGNHVNIFGGPGHQIRRYRYFDPKTRGLDYRVGTCSLQPVHSYVLWARAPTGHKDTRHCGHGAVVVLHTCLSGAAACLYS